MFDDIHDQFEEKKTDLFELQQVPEFSKYILIRSLDTQTLKDIISTKKGVQPSSSKQYDLYKELFETHIDINELLEHIKKRYPNIRKKRKEQEKHLPSIIQEFGAVKCGIRNDNMNDAAKALVRNKSIKNLQELKEKITNLLEGTINGYLLWQYYNQATNDLIEHLVNDHQAVIPTLRKIHDIDFFININGNIVPFDLKITHISNDFFDQYLKGISVNPKHENCNDSDDYCVNKENQGESDLIKNSYKEAKKKWLPAIKGQNIESLIQNLQSLNIPSVNHEAKNKKNITELREYYKDMKKEHEWKNIKHLTLADMVEKINLIDPDQINQLVEKRQYCIDELETDRKVLEWWNYKNQGERLFKNNNRFFIFLAYRNSFEDARPLKGNVEALETYIHQQLDLLSRGEGLNTIHYIYDKGSNPSRAYTINSSSILYSQ